MNNNQIALRKSGFVKAPTKKRSKLSESIDFDPETANQKELLLAIYEGIEHLDDLLTDLLESKTLEVDE